MKNCLKVYAALIDPDARYLELYELLRAKNDLQQQSLTDVLQNRCS